MRPGPPPRPDAAEERRLVRMLRAFSPVRPGTRRPTEPPDALAPLERFRIPHARGSLDATWYPAPGDARGAVLLGHPYLQRGQAYFHRHGRIEALRREGYHAMTFDFAGLGGSDPSGEAGDRDVHRALDALAARAPDLPRHLWGVSAGGYWAHLALPTRGDVAGAVFEDVSPHLFEYATRGRPWRRVLGAVGKLVLPRGKRWLDVRLHAPHLGLKAACYVGGALDDAVPPEETRRLASLAGADVLLVAGARHLEALKRDPGAVIGLALGTLRRAA